MQIRLNKKNAEYMNWLISEHISVNDIIESLIQSSQPDNMYDMVKYIYKKVKDKEGVPPIAYKAGNSVSRNKEMSPAQFQRYSSALAMYKESFERDGSWGTDSKLIDSTFVFKPGDDEVNEQLWVELCDFVMEKNVDYTLYIPERML